MAATIRHARVQRAFRGLEDHLNGAATRLELARASEAQEGSASRRGGMVPFVSGRPGRSRAAGPRVVLPPSPTSRTTPSTSPRTGELQQRPRPTRREGGARGSRKTRPTAAARSPIRSLAQPRYREDSGFGCGALAGPGALMLPPAPARRMGRRSSCSGDTGHARHLSTSRQASVVYLAARRRTGTRAAGEVESDGGGRGSVRAQRSGSLTWIEGKRPGSGAAVFVVGVAA